MKIFFAVASMLLTLSCTHTRSKPSHANTDTIRTETYLFKDLPHLEGSNGKIFLGGFSGLAYEGVNPKTGKKTFITVTDRGPNSEQELTKDKFPARRFGAPSFSPLIVHFELDEKTLTATVTQTLALKSSRGKTISGLSNLSPRTKRKDADELSLDENNNELPLDPSGLDPEGILQSANGDYWLVEEYRPSILQFSKDGQLKNRFIPIGSKIAGMDSAKEILPSHLTKRQLNRGFEGIALEGDKLFAFLQSPLKKKSLEIPVIEFDIKTKSVSNEYSYKLEGKDADKLGDAVSIGKNKFLVIEQNSKLGAGSFKKIFEVTLSKNQRRSKRIIADLSELGLSDLEKIEGITILGPRTIALINDNDFSFLRPDVSKLVLLHLNEDLFE
ncbi:MAG: esterase-like activity of phytase family protein [Bdellovibrionota bacterium]